MFRMIAILKEIKYQDIVWAFVISVFTISSCSKSGIQEGHIQYDAYQLIRDWYTLDTQFVCRATLWEDDSICRNEIKVALDTTADTWSTICATEHFAAHLEQWYY